MFILRCLGGMKINGQSQPTFCFVKFAFVVLSGCDGIYGGLF